MLSVIKLPDDVPEEEDKESYKMAEAEDHADSDYKNVRSLKINFNELSQLFPVENTP